MKLSVVSFETDLLGAMVIEKNEDKYSTPAIPMGGTCTHGKHELASRIQLTKQDQATTTWTNEQDCIILDVRERGFLIEL